MTIKDESKKLQEDNRRFKEALLTALGDTLRKPMSAKLGYQNSLGEQFIKVPDSRTDQPDKYYFHEAGGTGFQGEAFLKSGSLEKWQQRYGTPIYIQKHQVSGEWEIIGLDTRYANQFFSGVEEDDNVLVPYHNIAPGLLTTTLPPSMQARVLEGAYRIGNNTYYVPSQLTIDWSDVTYSGNIPTTPLKAKFVLVQIEPVAGTLSYKYGSEFPSSYSNKQVFDLDNDFGTGTYIPLVDDLNFRCGYIRLVYGITSIQRNNIWAIQDLLTLASADSTLDKIVVAEGQVVVDRDSGTVVFVQ